MEELLISVASGALICAAVAIPWFIFIHVLLSKGDFADFNKRKH